MSTRSIVAAAMLLPLTAVADDISKGEEIFNRKCSQCHTFAMAQAMLEPVKEKDRPEHLRAFLETHPAKLDANEKDVVIKALSQRTR
ncbi:MAG: hypothetical protein JSW48_09980 [Betaproteobacteria bacterium]|jgi:mono/diheme cytochrome c family protein|nr:MAG: hypothetical protein JSW48_09980 [Betaproteobacteria bacterium]